MDEYMRDTSIFIGLFEEGTNAVEYDWRATAFIATVAHSILLNGKRQSTLYIVTAEHVVATFMNQPTAVRIRRKDGEWFTRKFHHGVNWFYHPTDSQADIALAPVTLPHSELRLQLVPEEGLLADEEICRNRLSVGDKAIMVGISRGEDGKVNDTPAIRRGHISGIPLQQVPAGGAGLMDAYYLDVASSGGFSGAPVFTPNKWFASGTNGYYILGLIHGHRNVAGNPAIVSPAQKTKETLNHPELVALRVQHDMERAESQRAAEKAPTLRGDSLKDDAQ